MVARHRRPSAARTATRTAARATLLFTATGVAGLGVTATSQAATTAPVAPTAASQATPWQHQQHLAHLAHTAQYRSPAHLTAYRPTYTGSSDSGGGYQSCVVARESGGDPNAVNPYSGAGGLFQFLPSTWRGLGYGGRPQDAPVWQQTEAFQRLYAQQGRQPWSSNGC